MRLAQLAEKLRREQTTEQMLDAFVADAARSAKFVQEQYLTAIKTLIAWPEIRDAAYKKYAADIGRAPTTDAEKKQALFNHVMEKYEQEPQ